MQYLRVLSLEKEYGKYHLQANWGVAAPNNATKLATLMIEPPVRKPRASSVGFFFMARMAYLHPHHTPLTLMFIVKSLSNRFV